MHDCKTTFRGGRSSAQRPPSSYLPLGLISVGIIASWYVMDDVTWSSFVTLYSITLQYDAQLARRNSPRSREWRGGETIVAQQWRRRGKGWRGGGKGKTILAQHSRESQIGFSYRAHNHRPNRSPSVCEMSRSPVLTVSRSRCTHTHTHTYVCHDPNYTRRNVQIRMLR